MAQPNTPVAMERSTRQRDAIREAIGIAGRPLSPLEVLALAQAQVPGLSLATVYRNLKLLLEAEQIKVVSLPGETARYEPAGHAHHHHFKCTRCERVFDVHRCPGELRQLAPRGFVVEHHEITLYGRCSTCVAPRVGTGPAKRAG
jgi:Fur family ferric uptake transcriptional regulator